MWRRFISPQSPPYDPLQWVKEPLPIRAKQVCHAWILQGFGAPLSIYAFYVIKVAFYIAAWIFFCSFSPQLGSYEQIAHWYLDPLAFQKAILWSMLFEGLGLGCGSGPLTARYIPPFGGFLYTLRLRTLKLPLFPNLPFIGQDQRGWLDVLAYAGWVIIMLMLLCAPTLSLPLLLTLIVWVVGLGVLDKTLFLMMRAEHYWVVLCIIYLSGNQTVTWITMTLLVHCALWFWAGFSKLNSHFPTVVAVMLSNHPFNRSQRFRKALYRNYPHDVRPSRLTQIIAHMGTALELGTPILFLIAAQLLSHHDTSVPWLYIAIFCALNLHIFITSNVPMGVPIEWNIIMVYAIFALFIPHLEYLSWDQLTLTFTCSEPSLLLLNLLLLCFLLGFPLLGNLYPHKISFLVSMRYYAGNWPYSIYLFKGECYQQLQKIPSSAPWIEDQLGYLYDKPAITGIIGRVMGFRMMHLQGRLLSTVIPQAIDLPLAEYMYMEGEVLAGLTLGWNFGDGHLHQEQLLQSIQKRCQFKSGELRCIFVESQPLAKDRMDYKIYDAHDGLIKNDCVAVSALQEIQPWESIHES